MKILHVCLCGPVTDGWSYQDNLLPKYHRKMGYEVTVLASEWVYDQNGTLILTERNNYINEHDVKTIRIKSKWKTDINSKIRVYGGIRQAVNHEKPDIIFVHGSQLVQLRDIYQYVKRNKDTRMYVDSHSDFSNSASNWLSKNILHKIVWKHYAQKIEPYVKKFYGVLPARVDFLVHMYKLPRNKIELLVMGADDELVEAARKPQLRQAIRTKYNIGENDFLIVTGGKIDKNKTQTLLLMEAVQRLSTPNVKLMVFGSVSNDLRYSFDLLLGPNILYAGWIPAQKTYEYFNAADLVVFPGLHSVFWEQTVGLGQPCIFKYIPGFTHVDLGGNCDFLYEDSVAEIEHKIQNLIDNRSKYEEMKSIALERGMDVFSYKTIAERSIEVG